MVRDLVEKMLFHQDGDKTFFEPELFPWVVSIEADGETLASHSRDCFSLTSCAPDYLSPLNGESPHYLGAWALSTVEIGNLAS